MCNEDVKYVNANAGVKTLEEPVRVFESMKQAKELLNEWKDRLELSHWRVTLRINCKPEDFENKDVLGEIRDDHLHRAGAILILDPKYFDKDCILDYCAEYILVHELLHLHFYTFAPLNSQEEIVSDMIHHQMLDIFATALIRAKYNLPLNFRNNGDTIRDYSSR